MAGHKAVIVLTPNGRRQTIKVTPNSTILKILEEVCSKHGFTSEDYNLTHHNHILDTTTTIRFSGLPNNALLEMAEAKNKRLETNVVLGLQLEDGTRLLGTFSPSDILQNVLGSLCPLQSAPDSHPVIIYMRREVYGEVALNTTTLRELGLTGGRAMLRLVHRTPEELRTQANVSAPLPARPVVKEEEEYRPKPKPMKATNASDLNTIKTLVHGPEKETPVQSYAMDSFKGQGYVLGKGLPSSQDMNDNTDQHPGKSGLTEQNKGTDDEKMEVSDENEENICILGERNAVAYDLANCEMVNQLSKDLPDDFYNLTVGDVRELLKDLKRRREELEEDRPLLTKAQRDLEDSKKALRQLAQYKRCVLRIQFPDRIILQGTFSPTDNIQTVMDFIRSFIKNPDLPFHLFTTPPKVILNSDASLVEQKCVPCALLHFGIDSAPNVVIENQSESEHLQPPFLKPEIMEKLSSPTAAIIAASRSRGLVTQLKSVEEDMTQSDQPTSSGIRSVSPSRPSAALTVPPPLTQATMPKWFKPSK